MPVSIRPVFAVSDRVSIAVARKINCCGFFCTLPNANDGSDVAAANARVKIEFGCNHMT